MKHTAKVPVFPNQGLGNTLQYTYATTIGNRVYVRARQADGTPAYVEVKYQPTYYLPCQAALAKAKAFDGTPLAPFVCDSIFEGKEFLEKYPGQVYGDIQCEYMQLHDSYGTGDIVWNTDKLYIWFLDIEVEKDSQRGFAPIEDPFAPVTAITVVWQHGGKTGKVIYGFPPPGANQYVPPEGVTYIECQTEEELLLKFLDDFRSGGDYPDIITGWNVQFFDIPYVVNRMKRLFTEETWIRLAPMTKMAERDLFINGYKQTAIDIKGVAILDYYEIYRKFCLQQRENYRLDTIATIELGKKKVSYQEFRTLSNLYHKDYAKFIAYNLNDVELVVELDEKKKYLELVYALAYNAKSNFTDTFKQVRLWDIMIYNKLRGMKLQIPPRKEESKTTQYEGAYVKEPLVGMHGWIVSFDVASMYPHIIREWNLSPEAVYGKVNIGKLDGDHPYEQVIQDWMVKKQDTSDAHTDNVAIAANGVLTNHQEGFLPNMLKTLYDERVRYKKLMKQAEQALETETDPHKRVELAKTKDSCNNQQEIRKVNLNSAYGAMGSAYFRFFDVDLAEAVTVTGQMVIRWVARDINAYLNKIFKTNEDYIVASDTDSVYIKAERVADLILKVKPDATKVDIVQALDDFCQKKLAAVIVNSFEDIAEYMNVAEPCLRMARDIIADKGVWTAKKRYILNMWDKEGTRYDKPKLKIMGIEAVKSSTPSICRDNFKESFNILMNGTQDQMWTFVEDCRAKFNAASFEDVAFPRSVNNITDYKLGDKGVPIHVRGTLAYNEALSTTGLTAYQPISEGEKIKYVYLKQPNMFFSHVLSAPGGCPPEWEIEKFIDYNAQFTKAFEDPLAVILKCAGWKTEFEGELW